MSKLAKSEPIWVTREGKGITIRGMSSAHLLSAIHLIERNRMNAITEMATLNINTDNFEYYEEFPESYNNLIIEAKRRKLIGR